MIDKNKETLDDLMCGYSIIQPINKFRFSIDSVLLAHFANVKKNDIYVDFCSGSGVVAFLILAHDKVDNAICFEVQEEYCELIRRSAKLNNIENNINVYCEDLAKAKEILGSDSVDMVTCNPPYLKENTGKLSEDESINIARREIKTNIEAVIKSASEILKNKGRLTMVHISERTDEIMSLMKKYNLPVKRARLVQSEKSSEPSLILVEGIKNASPSIVWQPVLYLYEDGEYSKEIKVMYGINTQ